jgi:hypothetical protein
LIGTLERRRPLGISRQKWDNYELVLKKQSWRWAD